MSCKEIWLVRHGETASNKDGIVQGGSDVPLNALGVEQAEKLGAWMAARAPRPTTIIASPLSRAKKTAEIVASALALQIDALEPRLQERSFGAWEGHTFAEVMDTYEGGDAWDARPPEGENPADLATRAWAAFDEWIERDVGERLMIVAHGGPIGAIVCRALGVPFDSRGIRGFKRDNTGFSTMKRSRRSSTGFALGVLNATFHLD